MLETSGNPRIIVPQKLSELRDTLILEALRSIPKGLGKYSGERHDFNLRNGSVLHFRYCSGMKDVTRYQGVEIHWLIIDELTHY